MAFGQILVNWLLIGCFYAAVALGFSLVWGIMNIVNLAHGAFLILGAYVAYFAFTALGLNPFLGILVAMGVLFVTAWVIQYAAINRVIRAPLLVTFMLTFGLDLLITNLVQQVFTANNRAINASLAGVHLNIGETVVIPVLNVFVALIAIILTAALATFLARTRTGNAILAVGMDRDAARLMGINIARTYALTFGIGGALAGAAGAMLAMLLSFQPVNAGQYTLFAFVVVALGGLGTPWGALAGGLLFGLATTVSGSIPAIGPGLQTAVAFAVLVLVLVIRPKGVLGKAFYS